jgi:IclR family transcriptional regulator, KDG regulon repressor
MAKSPRTPKAVDAPPPAASGGEKQKDRAGVQSLERAFAILEEVAQFPGGLSLGDLAKRVGLHTSTTFHLVRTMVNLGYARQSSETKRYHIGRKLFALASGAAVEVEIAALATPILEELAGHSGEMAYFAIFAGDELSAIARVAGNGPFQLVDNSGGRRPLHATALGKAVLATLAPAKLEAFLANTKLEPITASTITDADALRNEIMRVREAGIAYDDGEYMNEVRCVAAAVTDFTGKAVGAIGISGPVWRISLPKLPDLSKRVSDSARALSKVLGAK